MTAIRFPAPSSKDARALVEPFRLGSLFGRPVTDRCRLFVAEELDPPWVIVLGPPEEVRPTYVDEHDEEVEDKWVTREWDPSQVYSLTGADPLSRVGELEPGGEAVQLMRLHPARVAVPAKRAPPRRLPLPTAEQTPEERGRLLIQYVRLSEPVTGLDFRRSNLVEADLTGANLFKVQLSESKMIRCRFDGANLIGANLTGCDCREASFVGSDLTEVQVWGADLGWADLSLARLWGVKAQATALRGATLSGVQWATRIDGAWSFQAIINHTTVVNSDWTADDLKRLRGQGVSFLDLHEFPEKLRHAIFGDQPGLALTFGTRLNRIDRYIIDGVIVSVLGRDTTCEIAEFVIQEGSGRTRVRLVADSPDQLLAVALVLTDIVPSIDSDVEDQREAVKLWGQRYVSDDLSGQWKTTAQTLNSIELRIAPRKLNALVEHEPAFAAFEGFTAFQPDTFREQARSMFLPVWAAMLDAADKGVVYTLMKGAEPLLLGESVNTENDDDR